jgi:hypothetical protein
MMLALTLNHTLTIAGVLQGPGEGCEIDELRRR